jgi:nitrite reductase/ring-hydroxylating ferredoxin subunit
MQEIIKVATVDQIRPGQMLYIDVEGLPLALANIGGTIYAFSDSCRHAGGSLSSGILRDDVVTCPLHGWAFNVPTGKSIIPPVGLRVPTYHAHVEDDNVFVTIDWPS